MIFPSIDLMGGRAVQLVQGKREQKKIEIDDVLGLAKKFSKYTVQLIDLDAAMGNGDNLELVRILCRRLKCRVGGGIRTIERARELVKAGAEKIIIGSAAFKGQGINVLFLKQLNRLIGQDRIIIAVDSKEGKVVVDGWKSSTKVDTLRAVKELEPYCSEFLYTYVDKEGMMEGTNFSMLRRIRQSTSRKVTAAGGISSTEEINRLERAGINSVLGMALYTGRIKIS